MKSGENGIERLKKRLYSRTEKGLGATERRRLEEHPHEVRTKWDPEPPPKEPPIRKDKVFTGLLIFSALFFIVSLVLSVFFFSVDRNTVSSDNIDIEIQGPSTVGGGEELVLQILVTNRNPTAIEGADLLVEYPPGTRVAGDLSRELLRARESLGTLQPGERVQKTVRAVLFGEEGSDTNIKATIEYRVEGSNAIFYREQGYDLNLSNAPLALLVESVEETSSGQEVEFLVTVASNSETTINDVLLVAEYPFGFEFSGSSPQPFAKNSVWRLGDVKPEGEHTIRVRGTVLGENEEERIFRFSTGIASKRDETKLETAFVTALQPIVVQSPFIGVNLAVNGDTTSDPIIRRGDRVRTDVTWFNNVSDKIFDAEIDVRVQGAILDERSVTVQQGFYQSSNNTVMWNRETLPSLGTLSEGGKGTVSFSFSPLSDGSVFRTPTVTFDVTIRGKRISENNVPEAIQSTLTRTVKVVTDLGLSSQSQYSSGPFSNTGPVPPQVEEETTYTIVWDISNSTNPMGDVSVSGTLPSYMRFVGAIDPSNAQVEFNEVGGQVRWNVGAMSENTTRSVAFQVALSPSLSQVGTAPVLINQQVVEGVDTFTTTRVQGSAPAVTTRLTNEPNFESGDEKVVE